MINDQRHYLLTLRAEDRPGLLHLITGIINRKLIAIEGLTAARTDIRDIVLVSVELQISERALTPLVLKLENIIEVFAVEAQLIEKVVSIRSAFFKLDKSILSSTQAVLLTKYRLAIINMDLVSVLVVHSGSDEELRRIYNELDGPYLLGYSQTGLIADCKLISEDQSSVINRLAA